MLRWGHRPRSQNIWLHQLHHSTRGNAPYPSLHIFMCKLGTLIGFHVNILKMTRTVPTHRNELASPFAILENKKVWVATLVLPLLLFEAFLSEKKNHNENIYLSHYERLNGMLLPPGSIPEYPLLSLLLCSCMSTSRSLLSLSHIYLFIYSYPCMDCKFTLARNCLFLTIGLGTQHLFVEGVCNGGKERRKRGRGRKGRWQVDNLAMPILKSPGGVS